MSIHRENLRKRIRRLGQLKQELNHKGPVLWDLPSVLTGSPAHARAIEAGKPFRLFECDRDKMPPGGIVGVEIE